MAKARAASLTAAASVPAGADRMTLTESDPSAAPLVIESRVVRPSTLQVLQPYAPHQQRALLRFADELAVAGKCIRDAT